MFPLNIANIESLNMAARSHSPEELWHLSFGHLNYNSLVMLTRKRLVKGMPALKEISHCEGCVMAKQVRNSFHSGVSRRTSSQL